jgi:hypothetical protein
LERSGLARTSVGRSSILGFDPQAPAMRKSSYRRGCDAYPGRFSRERQQRIEWDESIEIDYLGEFVGIIPLLIDIRWADRLRETLFNLQ